MSSKVVNENIERNVEKIKGSIYAANEAFDSAKEWTANAWAEMTTFWKILFMILGVLSIYIIYKMIKKEIRRRKLNPLYFKRGKLAKEAHSILDTKIVVNEDKTEYTYHLFVYISNWDYRIIEPKTILRKSNIGTDATGNNFSPHILLSPVINDLEVSISSLNGRDYHTKVEDFPIKRWTHIGLIVRETQYEVYLNGLLAKTIPMGQASKINKADVLICPDGGFSGYFSKVGYHARAITAKQMYEYSRMPMIDWSIFGKKLENLFICLTKHEPTNEQSVDSIPSTSFGSFAGIDGSIDNLKQLGSSIYDRMKERINRSRVSNSNADDNGTNKISCPLISEAPLCPVGTLACNSNPSYCYYPDTKMMYSTYLNPDTDFCPSSNIGKERGVQPVSIRGINLWPRKNGKDVEQCVNMQG